ncbi:MAG: sugar phosphate nucleotidyltransferase [Planctomycetota bacterium]
MSEPLMEKAVILARGLGTRMQRPDDAAALNEAQAAAAQTGVKAMIPIGRPFLDYVLSALADAGYRRVCLVVAPEHDAIRRYYHEEVGCERVSVEFAVQEAPKGTADAVAAAASFAGDEPFLVINSDDYYPIEALGRLREQGGSAVALFEQENMIAGSNIPKERIRHFAVGQVDEGQRLLGVLEKPDEATLASLPRPLWLSMNCWRFGPSIFEACRNIKPSKRGELELPDAVQYAIEKLGETFHAVLVRAAVLDLTSRKDVAAVAKRLAHVEVKL